MKVVIKIKLPIDMSKEREEIYNRIRLLILYSPSLLKPHGGL